MRPSRADNSAGINPATRSKAIIKGITDSPNKIKAESVQKRDSIF